MSTILPARPPSGAQASSVVAGSSSSAAPQHHDPVASSSRNPQLSQRPFFRYPIPTPEHVELELPPYKEQENVPLGPMLDRLTRKSYIDLRTLVDKTLPPLAARQKPKHVVEYAKATRQAMLKYLAVMRWKTSVDLATSGTSAAGGIGATGPAASFPTPHSNGESNDTSPTTHSVAKGKGRGTAEVVLEDDSNARGKVTDARRIQEFLEHHNAQQEEAIKHIRHVTGLVEGLRERNADLLTALSLRSTGSYTRLPSSLDELHTPPEPLRPTAVLRNVERLNEYLLYRLRCVDFIPPELSIERVADGQIHVQGGGAFGWTARLSVAGFDDSARWWLTDLEWTWAADGSGRQFSKEEKFRVLSLVNADSGVLLPRKSPEGGDATQDGVVDAPLVRLYNLLQHLSLLNQMAVLYTQALTLSQARWRGQLQVELSRDKKELRLRYWIRQRASSQPRAQQSAGANGNIPLIGGTLIFSLSESTSSITEAETVLQSISTGGCEPTDRIVRLSIAARWEVGEAGVGGGLKAGEEMDASGLKIDSSSLSMKEILTTATRAHAAHLARFITTPLLTSERLTLDPVNPPRIVESDSAARPVSLVIPVPSQSGKAQFVVTVSPTSGLIEIEDGGARDGGQVSENHRTIRAKLATVSVNEQKSRLADDLYRLISAAVMEDVEDNLRQLGLHPARRVALRLHDLAKTDLHPTSTAFVPLPVSQSHYFVSKITSDGISYELLKLLRVPNENGSGRKMAVGDRIPIDLPKIVERRATKGQKRSLDGEATPPPAQWENRMASKGGRFQVDAQDLCDMFTYCNALVAQTMVEQQLKDRGIPYTTHFPDDDDFAPPRSRSALAGMVPNICVNASDLFKGSRAHEVAAPKVYLVIQNWWKGTQCSVETIVRLRHQTSVNDAPAANVAPASSSAARAEGITFDHTTLTVRFHAPSIARCVPDLLEQWERLSKVIVVAGEVNRLNKTDGFRDVRMISFDLCTATMQYAHGYQVAITYTPTSDSYEATFFRSGFGLPSPGATATPAADGEMSPHQPLAPLFSHYLNEMASLAQSSRDASAGSSGRHFIQHLRATLPILQEAEALRTSNASDFPALVVRSLREYRLVWDHETSRFAIDVILSCGATRVFITDAAKHKGPQDLTCGPLTPIPSFEQVIARGLKAAKAARVATPGSSTSVNTPAAQATPAASGAVGGQSSPKRSVVPGLPPAVRLDNGASILCTVGVVTDVLRAMAHEIETAIAGPGPRSTPK